MSISLLVSVQDNLKLILHYEMTSKTNGFADRVLRRSSGNSALTLLEGKMK